MPDTNTAAPSGAAQQLRGETVVIVGPGRVGLSVGAWLSALGARVHAVAGRRRPVAGALEAAGLDRSRWSPLETLRSDGADVLVIAVADPALETVAADLATRPQARTVLHVSGHFDHRALAALDSPERRLGSWHPLRAFPAPSSSPSDAAGVTWAVDGHPRARALCRRWTAALGGTAVEVTGEKRRLYHLAASLAAGGVTTVLAAVDRLRRRADLPDALMASYLDLTAGAVGQLPLETPIPPGGFAAAITGPAARGDAAILDRQRRALDALAPELTPLFAALTETTDRLRSDDADPVQRPPEPPLAALDHR